MSKAKAIWTAGKWAKHKYSGKDDPVKEIVKGPDGKNREAQRRIPEFIPDHDAKILEEVQEWALRMDAKFLGFLGWESIIGIIPEIGDFIGVLISLYIYQKCKKIDGGLPDPIKRKMKANILRDFLFGLVPVIGDIADMIFKCNNKNARLLESHLRKKYGPSNKRDRNSAGLHWWNANTKQMEELKLAGVQPVSHDWDDDDDEDVPVAPADQNRWNTGQQQSMQAHAQPQPRQSQSWFSRWFGSTSPQRPADVEMGQGRPAGAR